MLIEVSFWYVKQKEAVLASQDSYPSPPHEYSKLVENFYVLV